MNTTKVGAALCVLGASLTVLVFISLYQSGVTWTEAMNHIGLLAPMLPGILIFAFGLGFVLPTRY